ncbi:MAG: ATP-binding protein, partial [Candidatus Omnitrophica bacterium]|nr:ATP-binding protein [Candidatus Omnitrophota bacterium]
LQQLLDLMHGHEIVLTRQRLAVQDLLRQAMEAVAAKAAARGITIACQLPDEPLVLDMDRVRGVAALQHLLDNAVKFNHDGGRVEVELSGAPATVRLAIRDTGIGIPSQELEKVFQPFYQVDQRLNRAYEGAGIGLTLAKRYIELHGGTLTLSSSMGQGTTIHIELPRPTASVALPSSSAAAL